MQSKTVPEAMRFSPMVCADTEMLSYPEITKIAHISIESKWRRLRWLCKVYLTLQEQVTGNILW
jgi:uncharacterized hydantoinase/oxoprolinase family protein